MRLKQHSGKVKMQDTQSIKTKIKTDKHPSKSNKYEEKTNIAYL